jgi:hypothetical protein
MVGEGHLTEPKGKTNLCVFELVHWVDNVAALQLEQNPVSWGGKAASDQRGLRVYRATTLVPHVYTEHEERLPLDCARWVVQRDFEWGRHEQ